MVLATAEAHLTPEIHHKAIHNLLAEVEEAAREEGLRFRGLKKASAGNDESFYNGGSVTNATDGAAFAHAGSDVLLFAGTAWLFAHEDVDGGATPTIDTLLIDEAGQGCWPRRSRWGRPRATWFTLQSRFPL